MCQADGENRPICSVKRRSGTAFWQILCPSDAGDRIEIMSHQSTSYAHLAPNPKSAYKQLFVKGTRIRARVLYGWYASEEPLPPEEIARQFNLPVEAVREAIAYCESNPPELAEDYAREEALSEAAGMNEPGYKLRPTPKLIEPKEIARINHEDLPR
jgi:uncharacterized protein (DUF433 family)